MTPRRRRFELRPAEPPDDFAAAVDYFSDRAAARQDVRDRKPVNSDDAESWAIELDQCADEAEVDVRLLVHAARQHLRSHEASP